MTAPPRLRVDLDAFADNLAVIRARVVPAEFMLVVKDDAYAHGLIPIVTRAFAEGVRWFGCLDLATARRVRAHLGDDARTFAWYLGPDDDLASAIRDGIDIGIGSRELLHAAIAAATPGSGVLRAHLKIDTGLNRNGFRPDAWEEALGIMRSGVDAGAASLEGVWSHIAEASDEEDDRARARFDDACARAERRGLEVRRRHLAASAAGFARREFSYDIVRMGAFAYGIAPAGGPHALELGLRPIATLRSVVTAIEDDEAVVAVGGRHGLPRQAAGSVSVFAGGGLRRVRAIAREEMRIERDGVRVGDEVVVFGAQQTGALTSTHWGEAVDTIGEEIQLRIHPDVPRVYDGG